MTVRTAIAHHQYNSPPRIAPARQPQILIARLPDHHILGIMAARHGAPGPASFSRNRRSQIRQPNRSQVQKAAASTRSRVT
jgi:hypothetical protein